MADELCGVGIDQEDVRALRTGIGRFFLHPTETHLTNDRDLVRVWTVKEAMYKATPGEPPLLSQFRMADAGAHDGEASCEARPELQYVYSSSLCGGTYTTVAFSRSRGTE